MTDYYCHEGRFYASVSALINWQLSVYRNLYVPAVNALVLMEQLWAAQCGYDVSCPVMSCPVWLAVSSSSYHTLLLWKRRGSITTRPHAPQRLRAAASINLLSLSTVPIDYAYDCTTPQPLTPPLSV